MERLLHPRVREGLGVLDDVHNVLVAADDPEVDLRRVEHGRLAPEPRVVRVGFGEVVRVERIEIRVHQMAGVSLLNSLAHGSYFPRSWLSEKQARRKEGWLAFAPSPGRYLHSSGPGSTRPSMRRHSQSCLSLRLLFWLLKSHRANTDRMFQVYAKDIRPP